MSCAVLIAFVVFTLVWKCDVSQENDTGVLSSTTASFHILQKLMAQRSERLPVGEYEEVKYKNGGDNVSRSFS